MFYHINSIYHESGFYYPIKVYYDDNTFEEFGFHVEDELVNNVPAFYAFRGDNLNSRIYNSCRM